MHSGRQRAGRHRWACAFTTAIHRKGHHREKLKGWINIFYEALREVQDKLVSEQLYMGTCAMVDDSMNDTKCADAFNAILQPINDNYDDPTGGQRRGVYSAKT